MGVLDVRPRIVARPKLDLSRSQDRAGAVDEHILKMWRSREPIVLGRVDRIASPSVPVRV